VLALLFYNDEYSKLVVNLLPLSIWALDAATLYFLQEVYAFIKTHEEAPKEHIYDVAEAAARGDDQLGLIKQLINKVEQRNIKLNVKYVWAQVSEFYQQVVLKKAVQECAELLAANAPLSEIKKVMQAALKEELKTFDPGIKLSDVVDYLIQEHHAPTNQLITLGVDAFDKRQITLREGEMLLLGAPTGKGKSHGLLWLAKRALMFNRKVLFVSLELDKFEGVGVRGLQAFYGAAARPGENSNRFVFTPHGFDVEQSYEPEYISEESTLLNLEKYLKGIPYVNENFRIVEFPAKTISLEEFESYLDSLEMYDGFVPNVICLDYIDLLKVPTNDLHQQLEQLYARARGVAKKKHFALATATQVNKIGAGKQKSDTTDAAGSYGKTSHADTYITYNQTDEEEQFGLARLYVSKVRRSRGNFTVLISQDYDKGQFIISSQEMTSDWSSKLKEFLAQAVA